MTRSPSPEPPSRTAVLIVGNYCHDVLIQNGVVVAETLGGASSFISTVLDGLSVSCNLTAKVGKDFRYSVNHSPVVVSDGKTTSFEAYFDLESKETVGRPDRILKRIAACDPISPSDLPDSRFDFGMVVGVGGEILPETLERMIELCDVVVVDIQALIRVFDSIDGTVNLVNLRKSGFHHLLPRIGFLKASSDEAEFMDIESVKNFCTVVVTNGKTGCRIYSEEDETQIPAFPADEMDPTGAGDSFLGGFVAGLVEGLDVTDAALLGNFFGSITVEQIGQPKFDLTMLQKLKDEIKLRKTQTVMREENGILRLRFANGSGLEHFHASLAAERLKMSQCFIQDLRPEPADLRPESAKSPNLSLTPVFERPM